VHSSQLYVYRRAAGSLAAARAGGLMFLSTVRFAVRTVGKSLRLPLLVDIPGRERRISVLAVVKGTPYIRNAGYEYHFFNCIQISYYSIYKYE
jgi:hypothetical protein